MKIIFSIVVLLFFLSFKDENQTIEKVNEIPEIVDNLKLKNDITEREEYLADKLKPISIIVSQIDSVKLWTSINKRKLEGSSESGVAEYFFIDEQLIKIETKYFGESGKLLQSFYIKNNEHLYVLEEE